MVEHAKPNLSIIAPVHRNADTLPSLWRRITRVLRQLSISYEIIFVDDASPDGSLSVLRKLAKADPHVAVFVLQRNMGQQRAVLTGLSLACGRSLVVLDADLQDPPEAIPVLLAQLQNGFAAVFAGRRGRYESTSRLLVSRLFKSLLHLLCGIPVDAGLFVVMNRQMADRLLAFNERNPHLVAMIGCTGLPVTSIPVVRAPRPFGVSGYNSWSRFRMAVNAVLMVLTWKLGQRRRH